jgi:predicted enzyme related to lactoylglutathione lyase
VPKIADARYVHTNLIAKDWRKLAEFYQEVFGCTPAPPERDYRNKAIGDLTDIPNIHLRGMHLRLPGLGDQVVTLEIFQITPELEKPFTRINRQGFGHIAFVVPDVIAAQKAVLDAGGSAVGQIVTLEPGDGRQLMCCYVTDPEGNIIELQDWLR